MKALVGPFNQKKALVGADGSICGTNWDTQRWLISSRSQHSPMIDFISCHFVLIQTMGTNTRQLAALTTLFVMLQMLRGSPPPRQFSCLNQSERMLEFWRKSSIIPSYEELSTLHIDWVSPGHCHHIRGCGARWWLPVNIVITGQWLEWCYAL